MQQLLFENLPAQVPVTKIWDVDAFLTDSDKEILASTGRKSNKNLGRWQLSASKHCQYFTPLEFSSFLCELAREWIGDSKPRVFDPTCGTGRLLYPWKKAGFDVVGVELDGDMASKARHLLGGKAVKRGDILEYLPHLHGAAPVVMTNPPFGLQWDIEDKEDEFQFVPVAGGKEKIGSEMAVMEACIKAVQSYDDDGIILAILPVGFADSEAWRNVVYETNRFEMFLDVRVENMFRAEYKIPVAAKLQVLFKSSGYERFYPDETVSGEIDYSDRDWKAQLLGLWKKLELPHFSFTDSERANIPNLGDLTEVDVDYRARLTPKGLKGSPAAMAMVDFQDEVYREYDPVRGIQGGAITSVASQVALLSRGVDPALEYLGNLGYEAKAPTAIESARLEKLKQRFDYLGTPLMPIKPHDRLAYFLERPYVAVDTVTGDAGAPIWLKGKSYNFRPGWIRENAVQKKMDKGEGAKAHTVVWRKESRALKITIETEGKPREIDETEPEQIKLLTSAFGLPTIDDVTLKYRVQYENYLRQARQEFPYLYDYQAGDIARLSMKRSGYLGYEMGGGKTVTSAAWASLRRFRRVLVVAESGLVQNWLKELEKFGFEVHELRDHSSIHQLREKIRAEKKSASKDKKTVFYVTSYEFLSLGDRVFDGWTCHREREGCDDHHVENNRSHSCRDCGRSYLTAYPACPKCGEKKEWSGICRECGYRAFSYSGCRSYPAVKRIRKLFGAVLVDEAQNMKSRTSLRGQAVRSINAKGKLVLTGTIMKGYITDIYWTMGWLLGNDNPIFPYPFAAGSRRFLEEFATYEFVDKQFADTLCRGRAKLIPEVSNLNRFRRLLAPMSIRRLKSDMPELKALPPKYRHVELLEMKEDQQCLYDQVSTTATEEITNEFRKASQQDREINMGIISRNLWAMAFAATVPTSDHLESPLRQGADFAKLKRVRELVAGAKEKGDKAIVFSGLRHMQAAIARDLKKSGFKIYEIFSNCSTSKRLDVIKEFEADEEAVAIVTGLEVLNRGYTIIKANHVVITDIGYTPEPHRQAEDRVHRPGQVKDVHIHYLFSKNTIDEHIYGVTECKQKAIDEAIDGKANSKAAKFLRDNAGNVRLAIAKKIVGKSFF